MRLEVLQSFDLDAYVWIVWLQFGSVLGSELNLYLLTNFFKLDFR